MCSSSCGVCVCVCVCVHNKVYSGRQGRSEKKAVKRFHAKARLFFFFFFFFALLGFAFRVVPKSPKSSMPNPCFAALLDPPQTSIDCPSINPLLAFMPFRLLCPCQPPTAK